MAPQTKEIGLWIITTAKISNKFSQQFPYISNTFSWESRNFHTGFHVSQQSPRHSKQNPGKLDNLEIQIFEVWSVCIRICMHSQDILRSIHPNVPPPAHTLTRSRARNFWYTHMYTHTRIPTYAQSHICTYTYTPAHSHIHAYTRTCVYICPHTQEKFILMPHTYYTHTHIYAHTRTHAHEKLALMPHTYYTHTHTYAHTRTHT